MVQLRFFGGLTLAQAADVRQVSVPTAKRRWAFARAWLYRELQRQQGKLLAAVCGNLQKSRQRLTVILTLLL